MILYPFGFIKDQGLQIGQAYQGGKIAYLSSPTSGLIVADGNNRLWSNDNNSVSTQTSIGSGNQNTINMSNTGGGSPIATYCLADVTGGYTDWYLPSYNELQQVYNNRVALGIDTTARFWTSSQYPTQGNLYAYAFGFTSGTEHQQDKQDSLPFFIMRSF